MPVFNATGEIFASHALTLSLNSKIQAMEKGSAAFLPLTLALMSHAANDYAKPTTTWTWCILSSWYHSQSGLLKPGCTSGKPSDSAEPGAVIPTNVVYINQGGEKGKTTGSQIGRAAIAEFGSLQMEFLALSQRTANTSYGETAEGLLRLLYQNYPDKVRQPFLEC